MPPAEKTAFLKLVFHSIFQTVWIESLPIKGLAPPLESQNTVAAKGDVPPLAKKAKIPVAVYDASSPPIHPKVEVHKKILQNKNTTSVGGDTSSLKFPQAAIGGLRRGENASLVVPPQASMTPTQIPTPQKTAEISPTLADSQTNESSKPKNSPNQESIILRFPFAVPKCSSTEVQTDELPSEPLFMKKPGGNPSDTKKLQNAHEDRKKVHFAADSPFFIHPPRSTNRQSPPPSRLRPPSPDILDQTTDFFKGVVNDVGGFFDKILPFSDGSLLKTPEGHPSEKKQNRASHTAEHFSM